MENLEKLPKEHLHGVSILIVNYNGASFIEEAILSFCKHLIDAALPFEVLIYDNASSDDSVMVLHALHTRMQQVKIFVSNVNQGFARANNILAAEAIHPFLVLLNNDTLTIDNRHIVGLLREESLKENQIYTCRILNADHSIQRNVFAIPRLYKFLLEIFLLKQMLLRLKKNGVNPDSVTRYFSGCYFVISKKLFNKVDGFDESFFFYHEECDFFLRLQVFNPKKIILSDSIIHYGGGNGAINSFGFTQYYLNLYRLFRKHQSNRKVLLKWAISIGFRFRILLLKCGIKFSYSPFANNYINTQSQNFNKDQVIRLHQDVLKAIELL